MRTIQLLGPPTVTDDDADAAPARAPRGRKAWALLAYLRLAERPPGRGRLAELLFADAGDPLGALRWTLAELRRTLGLAVSGDPLTVGFGEGVRVDLDLLAPGHAGPGSRPDLGSVAPERAGPGSLLHLGGELLEGVRLPGCPEFESWLLVERHRVATMLEARLRHEAVAGLAAGRADEAVRYARRAVAVNPIEEGNHELLVRALAMSGDRGAAQAQIAICADILRREVGVEVSPALHDAANVAPGSPRTPALRGRAAAANQLDAGRAAIIAGAADAGLQSLRLAVAEATRARDVALQARALAALGGALVHAVRGRDEEGAVVLHEALGLAGRAGDRATAVTAQRELGFIEVQAGRRSTADAWLARAQDLAGTDEELAAVLGVRGMNASDRGDYPAALVHFGQSVELAARAADERQGAWSWGLLARLHLLRGEQSQAAVALTRSLDLVARQRWMAFQPWPQTLRAELDLQLGDPDAAADRLEQAWVMSVQLNDPCWEGMAARGLGRLHAARGEPAEAAEWFGQAAIRCTRVPDRYQWVHAYVLDTIATDALARRDPEAARRPVTALAALAGRCEMREMVVRAQVHRHHLGDPGALATARALAATIDNPALADLLRPG